jgi:hypothetical protein
VLDRHVHHLSTTITGPKINLTKYY